MINPQLHKQAVAADRAEHRTLRMKLPVADWSLAAPLNSVFVAAGEFADAAREFPIVFVRAGEDAEGKPAVAPVAVFGVVPGENLFVEGGRWTAAYMPALLRMYPFCIGRIDAERFAICFDAAWPGIGSEGERLFGDDGEPTELLKRAQQDLEVLEAQVQRTRLMGRRLLELDLLREMRFDATLADGSRLAVDGFLAVDEAKLAALADGLVLELHRNGILGLVHAHQVSLGAMRKLVDLHQRRIGVAAPQA